MLTIFGLTVMVIAVLPAFPDTDIGRGLKRILVEAPARALSRIGTGKVAAYLMLAGLGVALVMLFEGEGVRLFSLMLPDTLVWFAMFDVGVFVDALLIAGAILATNGLRAMRAQVAAAPRQIVAIVARVSARARRSRNSVRRLTAKSADDDGERWAAQPGYRAFSMA